MKRYHASNRPAPRSIGVSVSDRRGAVVRAFWLVAFALIVASIDRPAQAEPFTPTGDIRLAGRHEDGQAAPQQPAYRSPRSVASHRVDDRAAPRTGKRGDRAGFCHPERSKCWRK